LTGRKVRKGSYLLFLVFHGPVTVCVGSLGESDIEAGEYCYAGSAMNGLDQRIRRHLRKEKRMHWHIDPLTTVADAAEAFVSFEKDECDLADIAERCGCVPVFKGFGSSDCGCRTHLFHVTGITKKLLLNASNAVPFVSEDGH